MQFNSITDWVSLILQAKGKMILPKEDANKFILFTIICYDIIWITRNKMLKQIEREVTNPLLLVSQINKIYVDYVTTWEFVGVMSNRSWFWNPPLPPFLKVNFDASINEEKNCIATMGGNHSARLESTESCGAFFLRFSSAFCLFFFFFFLFKRNI